MPLPDDLAFITSQVNLWSGAVLFIVGSIGALLNMFVFGQRTLRTSPCSVYLFTASLFDLCHLTSTLLTRILFTLSIETYTRNEVHCRIRSFIAEVASLCSVSCLCWGAFDRCMSTSRNAFHRRWSSRWLAYRIIPATMIVWSLISIPQLVFRGLIYSTCASLSVNFTLYLNYAHVPFFYGFVPVTVLFCLRQRTMKNIQNIQHAVAARRRLERYLNRLLVLQLSLTLFTSTLLMIQSLYTAITLSTRKGVLHMAIENLCLQVVRLVFYLNYTTSFYINYWVSAEVRLIIKRLFTCRRAHRIEPLTTVDRLVRDQ